MSMNYALNNYLSGRDEGAGENGSMKSIQNPSRYIKDSRHE